MSRRARAVRWLVGGAWFGSTLLLTASAWSAPKEAAVGDDLLGRPLALVVALALVSLLPFLFMSVTAFVKISTVLQIAKSAIGASSVPSTTVVMALAGALTVLAMAPVGEAIARRAAPALGAHDKGDTSALVMGGIEAVREPLREFLGKHASLKERTRFRLVASEIRHVDASAIDEHDLTILVPAFVVSELTAAFAIGFLIFLPFLVIDLVVANVLLALGMQMLNPTQVSLPFKILLFVAIDGWGLLAQALVAAYR